MDLRLHRDPRVGRKEPQSHRQGFTDQHLGCTNATLRPQKWGLYFVYGAAECHIDF